MAENLCRIAIMFTDIVGYSRMMHANEELAIERLHAYRQILSALIEKHRGTVIEYVGDAIFARFDEARDAVEAGLAIQRALKRFNLQHADQKLQTRIGIHWGEVLEKEGRIYGDDINIAARLEEIGRPEAVCVSQAVFEQLDDGQQLYRYAVGSPALKNIDEKIHVFQLYPHRPAWRTWLRLGWERLLNPIRRYPNLSAGVATISVIALIFTLVPLLHKPKIPVHYLELGKIRNLSPELLPEYYIIGIKDEIRNQLHRIPNLYLSAPEDGVGAPLVLTGSIDQSGKQIRLTYSLSDRNKSQPVRSGSVTGRLASILTLQKQLAAQASEALMAEYGFSWQIDDTATPEIDAKAYQYYLQARDYLNRSKEARVLKNAEQLFHKALTREPDYAEAYAGLCQTFWQQYEERKAPELATQAEQACRNALRISADSAEVHVALGEIMLGRGRWEEAIEAFNSAIRLDPKQVEAYMGLADLYQEMNRPQLAEQTYQRALALQEGSWRAWTAYGRYLLLRGRMDQAIDAFTRVVELTPDNVIGYSRLGAAYMLKGDFRQAARVFLRTTEIQATPDLLGNTGTMYYYNHDFEKAATMYRKAIARAPERCVLWTNLGDALQQLPGKETETRQVFQKAGELCNRDLTVNPNDFLTHTRLAHIQAMLGQGIPARRHIERARELAPDNLDVAITAAIIYFKESNQEALIAALTRAIELGYPQKLLLAEPKFSPLHEKRWFRKLLEPKPHPLKEIP